MNEPPKGPAPGVESTPGPPGRPGLPVAWRLAILAIVVIQFLFAYGAVWKRRFDWDRTILYSYATIPVLVLGALILRRRFSWVTWFVHTMEIASAKFAITASILLTILIVTRNEAPPAAPTVVAMPRPKPIPVVAPAPTVIDPASTGIVVGRVTDAAGGPLAGAIVFVASGLERIVFPVPESVVVVENDGKGFRPALFAAQTGQTIEARSTNGQLHTLLLEASAGNWVRNIPLLASGGPARLPSSDMRGVFSMRCAVHGNLEGKAYLALFPHPFFNIVGPDGAFEFSNVPQGDLTIGAFLPDRSADAVAVRVKAGERSSVVLRMLGR